jgi:hypothetical protein
MTKQKFPSSKIYCKDTSNDFLILFYICSKEQTGIQKRNIIS